MEFLGSWAGKVRVPARETGISLSVIFLEGNINATTIMNQPKYNTIDELIAIVPIKNILSLLQIH